MATSIPEGLVERLRQARRVAVLTGAGVSAESGVPTFRDAQTGLWAKYEPTELATPQAFQRNPKLVWEWYVWRRELMAGVQPNPGHYALAEMAQHVPLTLITQNVDGLHQQAGSTAVIELHGSIVRTKCFDAGHAYEGWPDDSVEKPPRCGRCGSLMRPDVVWFGEMLPAYALETATEAALLAEVFLSVGTSSLVHPAASLAVAAVQVGHTVVEINPNHTPLTPHASYVLGGPSGVVLPALVQAVWPKKGD